MIRNYLTVALRNLRKQPGYAFINIFGLGLGLASCLLIILYVQDELSYDQFYEEADHTYLVGLDAKLGSQFVNIANSATPMGPMLVEVFPEVEQMTRVKATGRTLFGRDDQTFYEDNLFFADSTFFEVFDHAFISGTPGTALSAPNSLVLTRTTAQKYFGDEDPVGQTLQYDNRETYTVTGLIEDVPSNTHFPFDILASFSTLAPNLTQSWLSHHLHTYIVVSEGASEQVVEDKFPSLIETHVAPEFEQMAGSTYEEAIAGGMIWNYYLQPMTDLYLRPEGEDQIGPTSDVRYIYILSVIALFILLLACINFMNLSTARSSGRAKEVGLRKVLGSNRQRLVQQFMGESLLMSLLAALVATVLIVLTLPIFNAVTGKVLVLNAANALSLVGVMAGVALVCGLLAGLYPALVLSAFQPVVVLKGTFGGSPGRQWLRSGLVVVQFALSIILLIGTGVVFHQLQYMQNERLGFAGEQVVVVPIESGDAREGFETFRQTLLQNPGIVEVAASDFIPGRVNSTNAFRREGESNTDAHVVAAARVSPEFISTLDLSLAHGRAFDRDRQTDAVDATIINEAAAREFGWTPEEALGKRITEIAAGDNNEDLHRTVIGVLEDFHFESLHQTIRPIALNLDPGAYQRASVRVRPENLSNTLAFLEQEWNRFEPGYPYQSIFLDEDFNRFYEQEQHLGRVFLLFTLLAVIIACLGLFGLASFTAQQRTKEIGVRKVLGASVPGIVALLSKEFTKLVLIASVVAIPVAYLVMRLWLQGFAYQVGLHPMLFIGATGAALLIAWLTVSYQSIKAATVNPVQALRYE